MSEGFEGGDNLRERSKCELSVLPIMCRSSILYLRHIVRHL